MIVEKKINNLFFFIIAILPVALLTGPFLPDLIISLTAIYSIHLFFKNKNRDYFNNKIVIIILLFWIYGIFVSLLSDFPFFSLESSLFYGRFVLFSIGFAFLIDQNKNLLKYFGITLSVCLFFVAVDSYLQFFFEKNIFFMERNTTNRLSGIFGDELILGSYISRLMPLLFFFIAFNTRIKTTYFFLSLLLLLMLDVIIYLSGERTAFFNLFLGTIIIILLVKKYSLIRLLVFSLSIILITIITITNESAKERMINLTIKQIGLNKEISKISDLKTINTFSKEHQEHIKSALLMFKDSPIIGKGPKAFRKLCKKEVFNPKGCSTHPHNSYFQLFAELGIIGGAVFLFFFFNITYIFIKQIVYKFIIKKEYILDSHICILCALYISLWPIIPTGSFYNNWLNVIYYLPLGLYLSKHIGLQNYLNKNTRELN